MDVRCERCSMTYDFDDARVPVEGLSVKCSSCGHVFRVQRADASSPGDDGWTVRQVTGNVARFKEMTTLQRWIVERRVARDDEISKTGKTWKRLGDIAELTPFFQAVEAAAPPPPVSAPYGGAYGTGPAPVVGAPAAGGVAVGARWEAAPQQLPAAQSGTWQIGPNPGLSAASYAPELQPGGRSSVDDDFDLPRRRGTAWRLVLVLVLVAGGAVAAVYALRPDLVRRYLGGRVNELAVQQVDSAYQELAKDSYAAIERARGMFEKAVALDPRYARAKAGLAQAELARAEYLVEEAAALTAGLAAAAPEAAAALQGALDERKKEQQARVDRAFAEAKEAIELEPDAADGLRAMADYYRIMQAPDSMRPLLEQARARAEKDPWVAYVLGASVAADPTLTERAIRYFDEALEVTPELNRARYRLARVFQVQGNKPKALLHVETVLKTAPDHERARALMNELNPPPPDPMADKPADKPLSYEQLFARADRLRENDKPSQALQLYERAVEMQPDDPDAHTGMGWCYVDLEKYDAAVSSFRRAVELVPRFSDAHFGLAEAYRQKGMKRDAVKHYRVYLDVMPEGDDAPVAKRWIEELQ